MFFQCSSYLLLSPFGYTVSSVLIQWLSLIVSCSGGVFSSIVKVASLSKSWLLLAKCLYRGSVLFDLALALWPATL